MFKRFLNYYKPHLKLFTLDMTSAFILAGLGLIYPLITKEIINTAIPQNDLKLLFQLALFLFVIYLLIMFFEHINTYWGHVLGIRMQYDMRRDIFTHLQKLSFNYYSNTKIGNLMSRIINDLFEISEIAHHGPEDLLISSVKLVGAFIILMTFNIKLTLIIFSIIPFMLFIMIYFNKKLEKAFREAKEKIADVNSRIEESLSGIRVVKSFTNEEYEITTFNKGNDKFKIVRQKAFKYLGVFYPTTNFLANMAILMVLSKVNI